MTNLILHDKPAIEISVQGTFGILIKLNHNIQTDISAINSSNLPAF